MIVRKLFWADHPTKNVGSVSCVSKPDIYLRAVELSIIKVISRGELLSVAEIYHYLVNTTTKLVTSGELHIDIQYL